MPSNQRTLVATLGPASFHQADAIARAGATAFRLNGSHMSARDLADAIAHVRSHAPHLPIIVDLQGAKMRLGSFDPIPLQVGQSLTFTHASEQNTLPLPHHEIFHAVQPGSILGCDDDRIRLRVDEVSHHRLLVTSLVDGVLRPRKGINVVDHPVHLQGLTESDRAHLSETKKFECISFACSFMRDGREADWVRAERAGATVIGKIERAEAIASLTQIATRVDEIWICRGDLGAQLGLGQLARWVAGFMPERLPVRSLIAGQVLEHLTHHEQPTRSEVCHLYDLLQRGYGGIVLSDETAIGVDPVRATRVARELMDASVGNVPNPMNPPIAQCPNIA